MTKAIFWDNDGVLIDTERLYFDATREVLATVGITLTQAQYVELFMVQSTGPWHLAEAAGLAPDEITRLRDERDARYCHSLLETPLVVPGIVAVLEALRGKYVMGIVTSAYKHHFDLAHRGSGLLPYFDFVLTGADYTKMKPHPEPYLRAIERAGVDPGACLAIEDSERGLRSAKAAGIRCAVLPNALTRGSVVDGRFNTAFHDADAILSSAAEILTVL